ncbi:CysJI operon transcriptional activator [Serratia proteamaculans]|uniref:LysR substrate-binding domain-containing protein n=1 Tax=Serratia proteamaculans TaxID=28151 RepID=UPI0021797C6F|nr:LysR substrate-binding domain-containing protein [Serratia proteamaculans]CAI2021386.1 CysJI operon transcriptional activator [Serratia proteamaculans]
MNITFKQLSVFVSVARNGTMTRAAQALFMTKGAISQILSELESQLGVRLFDRQHPRLVINHEGRKLLPVADELLVRMQGIETFFAEQGPCSPLTVGCTKTIGSYLLADMLGEFERGSGWLPQPIIANTTVICSMLNRFEIDVALLEGPATEHDIICEPWMEDEMVVIAAKNHPLVNSGDVSYARLSEERWILRELGSSSRTFFDNHLALELDNPGVVLSLNTFDAILACVYNNLGITFISRRMLKQPCCAGNFGQVHIEQRFFRKLTLCYHRNKFLSPTLINWITFSQAWAKMSPSD